MTVAEHVEMQRRAYRAFNLKRAHELLAQFGIDLRKKTRALSKGMRTATMVALAIAREVDILIFDEPTSGLDPINQRHVLNLIINESARGATVIFSSHQIGQVERAAERIAVIDRGRLALEGAVDDLKADRKIVEAILPSENFALNGLAGDPRHLAARSHRPHRSRADLARRTDVLAKFEALGASGLRIVDLNLEDIFLYAVSPADATADVVEDVRLMNYVEWLRVRNALRIYAIVLGVLIVIGLIVRVSLTSQLNHEQFLIDRVSKEPGTTITHSVVGGLNRTTIVSPSDSTTITIDEKPDGGRVIHIVQPSSSHKSTTQAGAVGPISGNDSVSNGVETITVDTNAPVNVVIFLALASFAGLLFATILGAPFACENGHLEIACSSPSRASAMRWASSVSISRASCSRVP